MANVQQTASRPLAARLPLAATDWPVLVGLAVLGVPTILSLGKQVWTTEAGAHGPIVLFVGAWLLVREWKSASAMAAPGRLSLTLAGLAVSLAVYVFGRAYDFISLEVAAFYGVGVTVLYSRLGLLAMRRIWFPIFYLAFLVPPPGWFIDQLTAPLKQFVSWSAMSILSEAGIPVAREGVTIFVAAYRLLVEDACSGMNSIVGLVAVSLLYIYLMRGSNVKYSILLTALTIPIAVLGNIIRIMTLILLTYFFGDAVAQGFLHETAGIFLFAVDLTLVFLLDSVLWRVLPKSWRGA
jgi:exosortase